MTLYFFRIKFFPFSPLFRYCPIAFQRQRFTQEIRRGGLMYSAPIDTSSALAIRHLIMTSSSGISRSNSEVMRDTSGLFILAPLDEISIIVPVNRSPLSRTMIAALKTVLLPNCRRSGCFFIDKAILSFYSEPPLRGELASALNTDFYFPLAPLVACESIIRISFSYFCLSVWG